MKAPEIKACDFINSTTEVVLITDLMGEKSLHPEQKRFARCADLSSGWCSAIPTVNSDHSLGLKAYNLGELAQLDAYVNNSVSEAAVRDNQT